MTNNIQRTRDRAGILNNDHSKIQEAEKLYAALLLFVEHLFDDVINKKTLNLTSIREMIKTTCTAIRYDSRFLLQAKNQIKPKTEKNYLIPHTVRTTITTLVIGTFLKLPYYRLNELGVAAMLHDIGMLKLPPELYLSSQTLTEDEKKLLHVHPIHSYRILQALGCPHAISLATLEHHERENGSGYPLNLIGEEISLYGKIIAVASSYEALSAKRHHRQAKDHHTGILELFNNAEKQYDNTVIRALVYSLSLFPIGQYVLLSNGLKGQVIDVNPLNPQHPVVQFMELLHKEKTTTIQTSYHGVRIIRPLTHEEVQTLLSAG